MLSGIGPGEHLREHDIEVVADRPGVGANLQDHLEIYLQLKCRQPITLYRHWNLFSKALIGLRWLLFRDGLGATNHFESCGFIRSRAGVQYPDIQYHFLPFAVRYDGKAAAEGHGFQTHVGPMRSKSRGWVRLASPEPSAAPSILFNYMSHEDDWRNFRACIRLTREILSQPALADYAGDEIAPGADIQSDEALDDFVKDAAESAYHPCGTCRMGAAICDRLPGTSGGWIMDIRGFQVWLSAARGLTRAQRREALAVLSGRSEGEASKAAIELGVDEARRCPHCVREGAVSRGMARGLRRYQCKGCGRTFNALSGTPLSGLHHKERWLSFGASLAKGETVKASAARCDVAVSTAFRWRHRFLAAARSDSEVLKGIVEADETYVLESRKGARGLGRKARRRGGKAKKRGLSREQVPVLMAADRSGTTVSAVLPRVDAAALTAALDPVVAKDALLVSDGGASYPPCAAALGVSHEALNRSMGERVRGDLHVQTVNSRHSRLKDFLRPRRGIATRYLDNYLSWFHLVGLAPGANDRACLAAAITR